MPATMTRSLGRLLLPALLALSPIAASAASDVTILRDEWGIPQVYANDVYGLYAGFGYAVAEDRLFQMEMARRSVLGTTAEVLGPDQVAYDTQTRTNFDQAKIRTQIDALPPEQRAILQGYAAGFNKRLSEVMADKANLLPKEFTDFGFEPADWSDFDVAMIYVGTMAGRFSYFSNELNNAKVLDALVEQHGETVGKQLFDQIYWIEDPLAPTTVPAGAPYQKKAEAAPLGATRFAGLADVPGMESGEDDRPRASNIWILGPEKTVDGSTILVNGPQFGNFNPAYVFSIGLHGAGFDLTGNTPFAVPNVLFGTNGAIAWGATAGPLDVNDYVALELNPQNPHQYRRGDGWTDMRRREETIKVKGAEDVTAEIWGTDYGVVPVFDAEHDRAFAFHRTWEGYEISTLMAWIRSTQAQDYDQWLDAAKDVATTINWYYADKDGNIGYVSPGYLPVRQASQDLRLPAKGDGSMDWQGIRPFDDVPKTLNPEQGWIANWNNRSGKGTVSTVEGSPWGSADRVVEIMSRIEAKDRFSPEEVWNILPETSFVDVNARYFVPRILAASAGLPADDPRQPMLAALADWDSRQIRDADGKATSPAVAILRTWMDVMVADVLLDDAPSIPSKVMQIRIALPSALLNNALLGKDAGVPQAYDFFNGEDPDTVVLTALDKARVALSEQYGSDNVTAWLAPIDQHVFDTKNYLGIPQTTADEGLAVGTAMNRGTENNMVRFRDGKVTFCAVTPPGQSGFIAPDGTKSPHYQDQLQLYADFGCRPQAFYRDDVEKSAVGRMAFTIE
ncbi:penicillin acylase family protein [Amaricoccus sp.]|uniref:penicillin acylase family protein n=1 Tax=Amaricoccus sp. TaxID=1872485 RepID=UPI0025C51C67|nr:penicillin acylase family protein [Amaricoccus sp.]